MSTPSMNIVPDAGSMIRNRESSNYANRANNRANEGIDCDNLPLTSLTLSSRRYRSSPCGS